MPYAFLDVKGFGDASENNLLWHTHDACEYFPDISLFFFIIGIMHKLILLIFHHYI